MVDRALVQVLIGLDLVAVLVTDAHEQEAALTAVDGDLPDGLIETLVEQLLPYGAEADLPGLSREQPLLQLLVELHNFDFGGGGGEDGLHPELSVVGAVLFGRQDLSEDVLGVVLFVLLLGLGVRGGFGRAADQNWCGVLY